MPRRVLVLRPDNLGDVVLFSGALRHLRVLYPDARIALCAKRDAVTLLRGCPYVDRFLVWEELLERPVPRIRFRGRRHLDARLIRWRARLAGRFDVVLVPVRSPTPQMHEVVAACRAGERIGIAGDFSNQTPNEERRWRSIYTRHMLIPPEARWSPELTVLRDFLSFLGADVGPGEPWPEFWTDAADRKWAEQRIQAPRDGVLLGVAPGVASRPGKRYPVDPLAQAIAAVGASTGLRVVLLGGPSEVTTCAEAAALLRSAPNVRNVLDLAGRSTVRQLVEVVRRCDIVLSQDTAALHIATALRKPTVGILGGGHFGRFYPWGDPAINRTANRRLDCYGCNWECRFDSVRCIEEIAPEAIARELALLLSAVDLRTIRSTQQAL